MARRVGPSENEGKRINAPGLGDYEIKNGVRCWISPSQDLQKRIYKDLVKDAEANQRRVLRRMMR